MSILQGTTPKLNIKIATTDFLVENVTKLELCFTHNGKQSIKDLDDVTIDTAENLFTYEFSESETLAFCPQVPLTYQLRFMFSDGNIMGTGEMSIDVIDLRSKEVMTE